MDIGNSIRIAVARTDLVLCSLWDAAPYLAVLLIMAAVVIHFIRRM